MTEKIAVKNRIVLGDRVPRFSAPLITGGSFDLHVSAGRWVVLSFLGSPSNPQANVELANLLREADLFREDHLVVGCVFTEPPGDIAKIAEISGNALFFLADYDGAISRSFGALAMPRGGIGRTERILQRLRAREATHFGADVVAPGQLAVETSA